MTTELRVGRTVAVVAIALVLLAACSGLPSDGRYQTHGGGWDNFRAQLPSMERSS